MCMRDRLSLTNTALAIACATHKRGGDKLIKKRGDYNASNERVKISLWIKNVHSS